MNMDQRNIKMVEYTGNDFYCDVAFKNIKDLKVEFENNNVLAYHHTHPFWSVHIVVVPKKHIPSFTVRNDGDDEIILEVLDVVKNMASKIETSHGECRIMTNVGNYQDSKHLHIHVYSGEQIR